MTIDGSFLILNVSNNRKAGEIVLDLRVLNYFLTVAKEGNITYAADVLHMTQPTLSRQLKDLEEELGVALFVRGSRQVSLTNAGMLFQQRAAELVTLLDKTRRDLAEQENLIGAAVSIGCVESSASAFLTLMLSAFAGVLSPSCFPIHIRCLTNSKSSALPVHFSLKMEMQKNEFFEIFS